MKFLELTDMDKRKVQVNPAAVAFIRHGTETTDGRKPSIIFLGTGVQVSVLEAPDVIARMAEEALAPLPKHHP